MTPLVEVSGLHVTARNERGETVDIVRDIDFAIARGEVLALIGESGSGKTTIALSLLGHARAGCRIAGGAIRIGGVDVRGLSPAGLAQLRGGQVSYVAQSAAAAFNPAHRIIDQVVEPATIRGTPRQEAERKARALFRSLALPDPERIGNRYPHQVSGGQLQRLMAAMALITGPQLVIFDEPTTALDVTTQVEVLRAFRHAIKEHGTTAVYVSHDLAVVAQMADRIVVLRHGTIREMGATETLLTAPRNAYTQSLLAAAAPAVPREDAAAPSAAAPVLELRNLLAGYGATDAAGRPALPVLHDVDLAIAPGAVLGVIGESGSGKSTLARVIAGLLPAARGEMILEGEALAPAIAQRSREQLRRVQIVFQMADTALNPARKVGAIIGRPLAFYHGLAGEAQQRRVAALLDMVQLPAALADRLPGELSGGQKQRVNLARALAAEPSLLLCDEVTASLDTVVGAAVLELLAALRRELGLAMMFISHDLKTVRAICDEVMILYAGRVVEIGSRQAVMRAPLHPYAHLLAASVPELRVGWLDGLDNLRIAEPAPMAAAGAAPRCPFVGRCAMRIDPLCGAEAPPVQHFAKGADIRCHRTEAELLAMQSRHGAVPAPITQD